MNREIQTYFHQKNISDKKSYIETETKLTLIQPYPF